MTTFTDPLPETLLREIEKIDIDTRTWSATVEGRELEGKGPAELRQQLAGAIYESLHVGRKADVAPPPRSLRDSEFEARLQAVTPQATARTPVVFLGVDHLTAQATVFMNGMRLGVPADLVPEGATPGQTVEIQVRASRPALSPGFFMADGSLGTGNRGGQVLRMYVHLTDHSAATASWATALECLEGLKVAYRTKISSSEMLYPRRDAHVIYLNESSWHVIGDVTAALQTNVSLGKEVSLFSVKLADGVAAAWEPADRRPGRHGMSFGEHRSMAVAEGLINHLTEQDSGSREESVIAALREANIDPGRPWRNLDSTELDIFGN